MVKETVLEQEERLRRVAALKKSKKQLKQTIRFNISVTPPPHDEQKWLDIPQDVREVSLLNVGFGPKYLTECYSEPRCRKAFHLPVARSHLH